MRAGVVYREVRGARSRTLRSIHVVHPGPWSRALLLNPVEDRWVFDPGVVQRALLQDLDAGTEAITEVDRTRAEELAAELGTTLPGEQELIDRMAAEDAPDRGRLPTD